ncbi:MAG: hypothetical protein J6I73_05190 [Treponema sp.]|nr:hypothetical protein [Treponema sp.]
MTKKDYKYFEILNVAAMKADEITNNGIFVFSDESVAETLKKDAKQHGINFDDASAKNEFSIENPDIKFYENFTVFNTSFPQAIVSKNLKKYHTYYNSDQNRLVILEFEDNFIPHSFYFTNENDIITNIEYSMTNVFYWQRIYELLCENISDETNTDRSFCILSFEKGKCKFAYSHYNPILNESNLQLTYNHFVNVFNSTKQYPMLFKNRCVERISQSQESTLESLISELDGICDKVKTDFEIFITNIDFDSYIQRYNERLADFVSQARNIIEKMLSNIFTLPLTYAGAIFAFDKLEDNTFAPFIFLAMFLYTFFSCGFLLYEFIDTFSLNKNFNKELRFYTNNSFFLLEKVKPDINLIKRRIWGIRIVCLILMCVFIALLVYLGITFFRSPSIDTQC